jgi:hypothetical protein
MNIKQMIINFPLRRVLNVVIPILLFGAVLFVLFSCTNGPPTPTGTTVPELPTVAAENDIGESPENSPAPAPPAPPRAAKGKLIIEGTYGTCKQTTNYPRNYLSVFRVSESGGQTPVRLYKSGEGILPCGYKIQVDCTVRDKDPVPGAISAYDLYDHFIGVLQCGPPPPPPPTPGCVPTDIPTTRDNSCTFIGPPECRWECTPCEGEWEVVSEEVTYEGECEERVKVTRTVYEHPCKPDQRVEVTREQAPEDCPIPECEYPGPGSKQFEGGNPWPGDAAACGNFGLVPGPGGFYITKCGLYFQWGSSFPVEYCDNGQEVSHVTECICEEDD